jgi:hypothetical protein
MTETTLHELRRAAADAEKQAAAMAKEQQDRLHNLFFNTTREVYVGLVLSANKRAWLDDKPLTPEEIDSMARDAVSLANILTKQFGVQFGSPVAMRQQQEAEKANTRTMHDDPMPGVRWEDNCLICLEPATCHGWGDNTRTYLVGSDGHRFQKRTEEPLDPRQAEGEATSDYVNQERG